MEVASSSLVIRSIILILTLACVGIFFYCGLLKKQEFNLIKFGIWKVESGIGMRNQELNRSRLLIIASYDTGRGEMILLMAL